MKTVVKTLLTDKKARSKKAVTKLVIKEGGEFVPWGS
jgi:hypothetical protein